MRFLVKPYFVAVVLGAVLFQFTIPLPAAAQFFDENFEEDEFLEEEEQFFESTRDDFRESTIPQQQDYTEGDRYAEDTILTPEERDLPFETRRIKMALENEKERLPKNIAWGAGTGLLLGGWFALINQGTNRQTQRSIGMGIVLGTLMGAVVGMRTLIDPDAPQAASIQNLLEPLEGPQPVLAISSEATLLGLRLTF